LPSYTFYANGDPKITAEHRTTLEITKDRLESAKGDCVVATLSEAGLAALPEDIKSLARSPSARITVIMETGDLREMVSGNGHPNLTFESDKEMVARKSGYVDGRTLMVNSDKAAIDLDRRFVDQLKSKNSKVKITIRVG
jgi:hypothetical protein